MGSQQPVTAGGDRFVFVSYRRNDTAAQAGRIADLLTTRFGEGSVFLDVEAIEPGVDFVDAVRRAIAAAGLLFVLIGPRWLMPDENGNRRIDSAGDYVRLELELALHRDMRIVPILVNDAEMPAAGLLPPSVRALARRNSVRVEDSSFRADISPVLAMVSEVLTAQADPTQPPEGDANLVPGGAGVPPDTAPPQWSATVLENKLGVFAWGRAWSVWLKLDDGQHRVRLHSSWSAGWHLTIGGVEFWRGKRIQDVTEHKFPLQDGQRTRFLRVPGPSGCSAGK